MYRLSNIPGILARQAARIWPARCLLCLGDSHSRRICDGCWHDLPHLRHACASCSQPLGAGMAGPCPRCTQRPPAFARVWTPFVYALPVDALLRNFKYHQQLTAGRLLADLLLMSLPASRPLPEALVPVPLHPARQRERGFNQALELARPLAQQLPVRLAPELVRRTRATAEQVSLAAGERRRNLRGAFASRGTSPSHIAIIDDVFTTGSTAGELARVLRRAGAQRIEVWCVARTVTEPPRAGVQRSR